MEGLVAALRAAGHRAELVRLPVAWERERLFDAALAWRMVPVDADVVIATNFPSYFVRHPRKVVWLLHQHRGAYDAADAPWSDMGLDDDSLETQRLLAEWDARALEEAVARFTISDVVTERLARYNGVRAETLYHPPPLADQLHPGRFDDYVFCATRLEHNKRPALMVDAVAASASAIRLVVAGSGSLEQELRRQADRLGVGHRVQFVGFVDDDELVSWYADATAVLYAPYDEDYGYVTLQAFRAGKAVITAKDAGGVLEWVDDGVNGFVTDGSPAQLGGAIDRLAGDRSLAQRMGEAGRASVASLAWPPVVERLLSA
jgi:glycosyltransferase involved in cell wall biosynthesis